MNTNATEEAEKSLLDLLKSRYEIAKSFTSEFHSEVKRNIDDYEAANHATVGTKKSGTYNRHVSASRYDITIPYIFATHESMVSSFFENMPDLVITGRTAKTDKEQTIKAIYEYFKDVADLDEFLTISAWWFFLTGFVKGDVEYKTKIKEYVPQLDAQGNPMTEKNDKGEDVPVEIPVYEYNDPFVSVDNPLKVYFSPESEFSISGEKIPYFFKDRLVDIDEIKHVYQKEVEADEHIDVNDVDKKDISDLKRAKVMYYYGTLPSSVKESLKKLNLDWEFGVDYRIYLTKDKILLAEKKNKPSKFARFYSSMNKFFGFGIGKTLRPFQEDMSIRRGQQIAYADRFAFPWLTLPNGVQVDQKSLMDYQKKTPLPYSSDNGAKPEYLAPPQMPATIADADNASRNDAQFVSGTLDLSKGAQQTNTVKTATGQQLFAQSQDKRLNKARKSIAKYYREIVIQMFKEARDNWNDEKLISYVDDDGNNVELKVNADTLKDIDFDTEIDFNLDSVSVNQDIVSQRWLSLLETALTVPNADVDKIFKKTLAESFKVPNPDGYVKNPEDMQQIPQETGNTDPNVGNPETTPMPQTLGSQLAPTAPYVGA